MNSANDFKSTLVYDYLIIGQGLAGTTLALELKERGFSVFVINNNSEVSSSEVAAGLYNPIVFKRLCKSWNADDFIPFLNEYYTKYETKFNAVFHTKRNIVKLFVDEIESAFWTKKVQEAPEYLNPEIKLNKYNEAIVTPHGSANVMQGGNVNIKLFLQKARSYFEKAESFSNNIVSYNDIHYNDNLINVNSCMAKNIVFCEGFKAINNPYFNYLPFLPTKGELVKIKCENLNLTDVINKGVFILPIGNNEYYVGATNKWNDLKANSTEEGILELTNKFKKITQAPFDVLLTFAGIRPTVLDRRPLMGKHPKNTSMFIFNGLGTKGAMMAPLLAKKMADFLQFGTVLDIETDINRFKARFGAVNQENKKKDV